MIGVNRHPWLLSRNETQLRNSIAVSAKLSINMAYDYLALASDIAFNISHSRWGKKNWICQTIPPWKQLSNFVKDKSQQAHGASWFVKKTCPSDTKNDVSIQHFFFLHVVIHYMGVKEEA